MAPILGASLALSKVVRDVLSLAPCLPLAQAFVGLSHTLQLVQDVNSQRDQAQALVRLAAEILGALHDKVQSILASGGALPSPMVSNIARFEGSLQSIQADFEKLITYNFMKRLLRKDQTADTLTRHHRNLIANLHLFGADRRARKADSQKLDQILADYTNSQHKLTSLLNADANTRQKLTEVKDLLYLCTRQIQTTSPGPERAFYEATFQKMTLLSGGRVPECPKWVISPLEVDIEDEIGAGAFSRVYRGQWNAEDVAVKVLLDGVSQAVLLREADRWSRLSHPRIHRFYRACPTGNPPFLVSALHLNGDALKYLTAHPEADRLNMVRDIASGMKYLHGQDAVHGDLKASNILIDDAGRACISDFGLSSIKIESARISSMQNGKEDSSAGTLRWMAPERIDGGVLDEKVDVYAFAMTLYEIYTGEIPFGFMPDSSIPTHVVDKGRRPQRPAPNKAPRLTDEMWALISDCWAQQPETRPDFAAIVIRLDGSRRRISNTSSHLTSGSGTMSPLLNSSSQGSRSPQPSPQPLPRQGQSTSQQIPEDNFLLPPPLITRGSDGTLKVIEGPDGQVQAATMRALIKRLISSDTSDSSFHTAFVLTLPTFSSVAEVIDLLVTRFSQHGPTNPKPSSAMRRRILEILKTLLKHDRRLVTVTPQGYEKMWTFVRTAEFYDEESSSFGELEHLLEAGSSSTRPRDHLHQKHNSRREAPPFPIIPPTPQVGRSLRLLQIDPLELARQLALRDHDLYRKIVPLDYVARGEDRKENALQAALTIGLKTSDWVLDAILRDMDPVQRALAISHLISVAKHCLAIHNFQSLTIICNAIDQPSIRRLEATWARVSPDSVADLQSLRKTVKLESDVATRRSILGKLELPCLPSIGVYWSSINTIDKTTPDHVQDDLINFAKRQTMAQVLQMAMAEFDHYQPVTFDFYPVQLIQTYLEERIAIPPRKASGYYGSLSQVREPYKLAKRPAPAPRP